MPPPLPDDLTDGGPYTGRITCLFSDGKHLYAGGWHMGVYRTKDGASWDRFDRGMTGYKDVLALAGNKKNLFAGTFQGEVYVLQGEQWRRIFDFGEKDSAAIFGLQAYPDRILAATGKGLFVSKDRGATFQMLWEGGPVQAAVVTSFPNAAILFGTLGKGLGRCKSMEGDCTIIQDFPGSKLITSLVEAPAGKILVATEGKGLVQTGDGLTFQRLEAAGPGDFIRALYRDDDQVIVSEDEKGLWLQAGKGREWKAIPFPKTITAIARHAGAVFIGTDGLGVFVLKEQRLAARNRGLLNFPEEVVDQYLNPGREPAM